MRGQRDVRLCALVVTIIACSSLWRLGLTPSNQQDVLVVDTARTAYVAKNLIEGEGYTTNDMPASLVGFYDEEGRLDDERWLTADRFPFAAFATAALYGVTGQRDPWTGVILYSLITFVGFLTALYALARRVTGTPAGGIAAVGLALAQSFTYVFLYMKDSDMLLLAVLTLSGFQTFLATAVEARSPWRMAWFGTVLAWSFLSRPNVGGPFLVALLVLSIAGIPGAVRRLGGRGALRAWLRSDLVAGGVATLWILPYAVHTFVEWGSPFFSANGLYQPILGTRFGMGTDTWWRYLPAGFDHSIGQLWREARGDVIGKFLTSWRTTLITFVSGYFIDLALAFGLIHVRSRPRMPGLRGAVAVLVICFVVNYMTLPMYSYKAYSYRHYLGFILPVIWLLAACTLVHLGRWLAPAAARARDAAAARPQWLLAGGVLVALALLVRTPGNEGNLLAMGLARFFEARWVVAALVLAAIALLAWRRGSRTAWLVVALTAGGAALYRPHRGHLDFMHVYVPATPEVWPELRQRDGLVASFALQTLVPWNTGRRNVMAPEYVMNLYEMGRVHHLEFEDVFIESPEAARANWLFWPAAPGFEGYERVVRYGDHLPGYRRTFHWSGVVGRPRFRVRARPKSSTVYTLVDRAARDAILATPRVLAVGEVANVVHTAYGFGGYYRVDGTPVVAATEASRKHYRGVRAEDRPWQDGAVTFFVGDVVPAAVTVRFYTVAANRFTFYWNLDVDEYTPPAERDAHRLGEAVAAGPGWHTVTLAIPPGRARRGLNALGFRADGFTPVVLCAAGQPDVLCAREATEPGAALLRLDTAEPTTAASISMLLDRLEFR